MVAPIFKFSESIPLFKDLKKMKYFINRNELISAKVARKEKYFPETVLKNKSWPYIN